MQELYGEEKAKEMRKNASEAQKGRVHPEEVKKKNKTS